METQEVVGAPGKKKRNKKKITFITLAVLAAIAVLAFIFLNLYINRSIAQVEGEIELPKLRDDVTILTDDNGVPHINANNAHDLYMAQGYVQANSRMFQMEMSRRQASGTLSEVVGEASVEQDKYFRTLGLRRAAEASYDIYSDESKQVLQWFADGVNAYIDEATSSNSLPVEFTLMGAEPEEWTPIDSLTIGKYMAFDLGGHWERQAFNYYALNQFPQEKAYELFPAYPENKPTIIEEEEVDVAASFKDAVIPHAFNGSNNWVVSGDKTSSGMPLLANDPHLGLATPSIWYQMHLTSPDTNVSGVIFAGVPGIILGHNDSIAWGVTNTGPDVQQLYVEKQNPEEPHEFLYDGKWEEADVIDEPIEVKDSETIDYQVVETRHGPVISEFSNESAGGTVMSLRWTALEATTELEAILEINQASDWNEFEQGLEKFLVPAQNFVFAGKDGTIAYKANGNIPIYDKAEDALLPLEGWKKENEWEGYIPFDELPTVINPDKGFIATANNKIVGEEDYPYHISHVWAQPYRYERISEVLSAGESLTADDMKALQMDQTNLQAREFVPFFMEVLEGQDLTAEQNEALKLLSDWDYTDEKHAPQPLIFHRWMNEIEAILYDDELPNEIMELFGGKGQTTDELLRKGDESIWIQENGGLQEVLQTSLNNTLNQLRDEYGSTMDDWQWGAYHQVQFDHPLSEISPFLAFFFNRENPIPVGGSSVTPMAASYDAASGIVNHGASWRFVMDTAEAKSYQLVAPGQAGHFRSEWYHDQMDDWARGAYHVTKTEENDGMKLTLTPNR
ncbi:penicillin acylase family protein [Lentibacillus amyloliquefaciens]|uniref:penicillin acylase family protein n=1 Tax=Lentibacillus amyloliquefaciens TaxID=1472767 RepID=UPI0009E6EB20|nr:penicillin acylase family protein [Lentibacillus amyloliquefaciens]